MVSERIFIRLYLKCIKITLLYLSVFMLTSAVTNYWGAFLLFVTLTALNLSILSSKRLFLYSYHKLYSTLPGRVFFRWYSGISTQEEEGYGSQKNNY
jgi:hypothetical protein